MTDKLLFCWCTNEIITGKPLLTVMQKLKIRVIYSDLFPSAPLASNTRMPD